MNIVYLLENIDKKTNPRYYIGSKLECSVVNIGGLPTIYCKRKNRPYYGSSSSVEMREDIIKGNRFKASILERVADRKQLISKEEEYMQKYNAVFSEEFYNKSNAILDCFNKDAIVNKFGETVHEVATKEAAWTRLDNAAIKRGFKNLGEMAFYIHREFSLGKTGAAIANSLQSERHFPFVFIKKWDMDKAEKDILLDRTEEIRKLIAQGASAPHVSKLLNMEWPAVALFLGDYRKQKKKYVSYVLGKSNEELEIEITKKVLEGIGLKEIADSFGMSYETTKRYFMTCVRKRLKSSDL